jgi:YVTN family beta-propeller protein
MGSALALSTSCVHAGQVPGSDADPDAPISRRDRIYAAEQFSNTVSVTDPYDNKLLGVIRLGDPSPESFSPRYRGQVLVHGMGFSPDHRTIAVVSIGSNSVTFIDTATNAVKHTTYIGRSPHEAFFTQDGSEVWVTVRGENYISVLDASTYEEKARIVTPNGPGMQIFSPDGKYAYICSSFTPETVVVLVATREIVGRVKQESPFCPNIAASPDGRQVWMTLKDVGRTMVFDARPPFSVLMSIDTGAITNHVNFARTKRGTFAYISVGGLNVVKVYRTDDYSLTATIRVGQLPHGIWPSGDGTRMYVGLENGDLLQAIDTASNTIVGEIPIGQAPQALNYVSGAVPAGDGLQGLVPIGVAGKATHFSLLASNGKLTAGSVAPSSVALFDQGLLQVLEASVTALVPMQSYVLGLAEHPDGSGKLEPLAEFVANPSGAAVVNAIGPIRQIVKSGVPADRRYLVIAPKIDGAPGRPVQVQTR